LPEASAVTTALAAPLNVTVVPLPDEEGLMVPDKLQRGGAKPSENVLVTPPALAVRLAFCALVTAATVAVKRALDDPAGTAKLPGMLTVELLLESVTLRPPV
jgi:hypothetical protein